ncbi:MAG: hypothetical protein HXY34_04250 [Candidatus Thorarchaeota archaeon]|nr:hypothetical protein [Candidatus Thorarchaeota archaeon]
MERLYYGNDTFCVGIDELKNVHRTKSDELVRMASTQYSHLMAVQLLNPVLIAGPLHLLSAAQNALNAWMGKYAVARSLGVEVVRFASAQKQISTALQKMGVADEMETVAVLVIDRDPERVAECINRLSLGIGPGCDIPFEPSAERMRNVMETFDITAEEIRTIAASESLPDLLESLSRCVAGRVSLVAFED